MIQPTIKYKLWITNQFRKSLHPVTRRVWRSAIKISMNKFLKKCLQLGWARNHLNMFSMSRNWINLHRKNNRLDKFKDVQYSTKFVSAWATFCSDPWSFFYRDLMLDHKMQNIPEGKSMSYHFKLLKFRRVIYCVFYCIYNIKSFINKKLNMTIVKK